MAAAPAAPTGLAASTVAHDSVTLTWIAPDHDSISGYKVLRGANADSLAAVAGDTGDTATEYRDDTVAAETGYVYAVVALSPDGESPQSDTLDVTTPAATGGGSVTKSVNGQGSGQLGGNVVKSVTTAPAAPTGLSTAASATEVVLTWDDPSDASITGYRVLRGAAATSLTELEADTASTATTHTDDTVYDDTTYYYAVQAINSAGSSAQSTAVSATTPALATAQSQEEEAVKVANLGRTSSDVTLQSGDKYATRFDTGSDPAILTKVRLLTGVPSGARVKVSIYSHDGSNSPELELHTLTNPTLDNDAGTAEDFTTTGFGLAGDTDYWVMLHFVSGSGSVTVKTVDYRLIDSGAASGWDMGYRGYKEAGGNAGSSQSNVLQMGVYADDFELGDLVGSESAAISNMDSDPTLVNIQRSMALGARFRTGSSASILHKVRMLSAVPPGASVTVAIHANNGSNRPGEELHELSGGSGVDTDISTAEDFSSASGYRLSANTDYWVVFEFTSGTGDAYLGISGSSTSSDGGGFSGWEFKSGYTKDANGSVGVSSTQVPLIAVFATEFSEGAVVSKMGHGDLDVGISAGTYRAGSFTTGAQNFNLDKVGIKTSIPSGGIFSVTIHSDDSGEPGQKLETLANPTLDQQMATIENFESSGLLLSPNTTYWVRLHYSSGANFAEYGVQGRSSRYSTQETGWSIGGEELQSTNGTAWESVSRSLEMAVHALLRDGLLSVAVTSVPLSGDTYGAGENLEVEYTFSVPVTTTGGTAVLSLNGNRNADYVSGSGTKKLVFTYRVQSADRATSGFTILGSDNSGGLENTVITKADGGYVRKALSSQSAGNEHKVDGSRSGCSESYCANLAVAEQSGGTTHGAVYGESAPVGTLSNRTFTYGGSDYAIQELVVKDSGALELLLDRVPGQTLLDDGILVFRKSGESQRKYFGLGTGVVSGNRVTWSRSNMTWDDGDKYRVTLVDGILLTNLYQGTAESLATDATYTRLAQPFRTGHHLGGYRLDTLRLPIAVPGGTRVKVSIFTDDEGKPGTLVQELSNPTTDDSTATSEAFTATGLELAPDAIYWVVVEKERGSRQVSVALATSVVQDFREGTGWGIYTGSDTGANLRRYASGTWSEYKPGGNDRVMKLTMEGGKTTADFPLTGRPDILGVLEQGMTLTATVGTLNDPNGLLGGQSSVSYTWFRVSGIAETEIPGAASRSYTATADDVGKSLKVKLTVTDSLGFQATATSHDSSFVAHPVPYILSNLGQADDGDAILSAVGSIDALAQSFTTDDTGGTLHGLRLVATTGAKPAHKVSIYSDGSREPGTELHVLTSPSALDKFSSTLKEFASSGYELSANTTYWVVIERTKEDSITFDVATSAAKDTATVAEWTIGSSILAREGSVWRTRTASTIKMALKANAGKPRVTGVLEQGMTAYADLSGLLLGKFDGDFNDSYQWVRDNNGVETVITGADRQTYVIQQDDVGKKLKVKYTYTDEEDSTETVSSELSGTVGAASAYPVSNLAQPAGSSQSLSGVRYAQDFTVGDAGVELTGVRLMMKTTGSQEAQVSIYTDALGAPGTLLQTLTLSGSLDSSGDTAEEFTANGVTLEPGAIYWVVVEEATATAGEELHVVSTSSSLDDAGGAANWSIGEALLIQEGQTAWAPSSAATQEAIKLALTAAVNSPPLFAGSTVTLTAYQGQAGNATVDTVAATDYDGDTLTYTVTGAGATEFNQVFSLDSSSGEIRVKAQALAEQDTTATYAVTLNVTDGKDREGNDATDIDDTVELTVNVVPPDTPGTVTLSTNWPQMTTEVTAYLNDPDGDLANVQWQWSMAPTYDCLYEDIDGATSASYTPADDDEGMFLRATVTYDDADGTGKSVDGTAGNPVGTYSDSLVWEGMLTVGERVYLHTRTGERTDELLAYGFYTNHDGGPVEGGLSLRTFTHDGIQYEVQTLLLYDHDPAVFFFLAVDPGDLVLNLDRALPSEANGNWKLHIGDLEFALGDADLVYEGTNYVWRDSGLDWEPLYDTENPGTLTVSLTKE